jgi:type II secretory pathway pseudopilin PulG
MASKAKTPAKPDDPAQDPTGWPAAWLPDPRREGELRWWNGSKWTDHVHGPASEDEGEGNGSSDKQPTHEADPVDETVDAVVAPEAAVESGPDSPADATDGHALKAAIDADPGSVVRVCPKCSAQGLTSGDHCPHCGASYARKGRIRRASRRTKLIIGGVIALLLIGGGVTGVLLKVQHDNDVAAKHKQQQQQAQQKAAAQAQAQQAIDQANQEKRTLRAGIVTSLQDSVTKDANKRINEGVLDGPAVNHTSCTPVGGGNTDDLTAHTGNFSCLAANKSNSDGTEEGYGFSATVNYEDGSYTWRLGGA